jgi:hypothetical protein
MSLYLGLHVKGSVFLSDCKETWIFSTEFILVAAAMIHMNRRIDTRLNVNFTLEETMKAHRRYVGLGGQRHVPAALLPGRRPVTCTVGWVGPRAGLDM